MGNIMGSSSEARESKQLKEEFSTLKARIDSLSRPIPRRLKELTTQSVTVEKYKKNLTKDSNELLVLVKDWLTRYKALTASKASQSAEDNLALIKVYNPETEEYDLHNVATYLNNAIKNRWDAAKILEQREQNNAEVKSAVKAAADAARTILTPTAVKTAPQVFVTPVKPGTEAGEDPKTDYGPSDSEASDSDYDCPSEMSASEAEAEDSGSDSDPITPKFKSRLPQAHLFGNKVTAPAATVAASSSAPSLSSDSD